MAFFAGNGQVGRPIGNGRSRCNRFVVHALFWTKILAWKTTRSFPHVSKVSTLPGTVESFQLLAVFFCRSGFARWSRWFPAFQYWASPLHCCNNADKKSMETLVWQIAEKRRGLGRCAKVALATTIFSFAFFVFAGSVACLFFCL